MSLRLHLDDYKATFGGGMIPFDNAYHKAYNPAAGPGQGTLAEAQMAGGYALLEAFIKFVESRDA